MERKLYYRKLRLVLKGLAEARSLEKVNEGKSRVIKSELNNINRSNVQKVLTGKVN